MKNPSHTVKIIPADPGGEPQPLLKGTTIMTEQEFEFTGESLAVIEFDAKKPPLTVKQVKESMGVAATQVKAESLRDQTFTIMRMKPFESSLGEGGIAYYCDVVLQKTKQLVGVVLGGQGVVEFLSLYERSGHSEPLTVTLVQKAGGKFSRYYVLE